MAGTVPTITPGSITAIRGLAKRPVYFLNLNGAAQPNLVVKGEDALVHISDADAEISIKWTSKLMKNVNNTAVNTKIMAPPEINLFKASARLAYPLNTAPQHRNLNANYRWVKMPYVTGLSDGEMWNEDQGGYDNQMIKNVAKKFMEPQVWTDLGKVVAVDLFNGNNDRFLFTQQPGYTIAQMTVVWANKGNIMFLQGGATSVIGLDTVDPSSQTGPSNLGSGAADLAVLQVLQDAHAAERTTFAVKCAHAVAAEISSAMRNTQFLTIHVNGAPLGQDVIRVDKDHVAELLEPFAVPFEQGLNAGIRDLRQYLQGKVQQYRLQNQQAQQQYQQRVGWRPGRPGAGPPIGANRGPVMKTVPQGVLNRMAYLGW
jgi:hypothetical protein